MPLEVLAARPFANKLHARRVDSFGSEKFQNLLATSPAGREEQETRFLHCSEDACPQGKNPFVYFAEVIEAAKGDAVLAQGRQIVDLQHVFQRIEAPKCVREADG